MGGRCPSQIPIKPTATEHNNLRFLSTRSFGRKFEVATRPNLNQISNAPGGFPAPTPVRDGRHKSPGFFAGRVAPPAERRRPIMSPVSCWAPVHAIAGLPSVP